MKELVVISGKGGTGKTSLVASLSVLAGFSVLADCDVDAADLHLVLHPRIKSVEDFKGGKRAEIMAQMCSGCGKCYEVCRFEAVCKNTTEPPSYTIDPIACEGCGVCSYFCPEKAIQFQPVVNGQWFISDTASGPMVHAKLGVAEENSGKMVALVRNQAKMIAEKENINLIIVDGPPGIGCPVIASVTGADAVLIVTEPSVAGEHDLKRVAELSRHFKIPLYLCINKYDLNLTMADKIENMACQSGITCVGRMRYDRVVSEAQLHGKAVVEFTDTAVAREIRTVWENFLHETNWFKEVRSTMKIVLPIAGGQLCTHFGHCERFDFYEINPSTGEICNKETMTAPPHEPGLLPKLLTEKGAEVVIAAGMGGKAQELFSQNGIKVVVGASAATGSPDDIVRSYLSGSLTTGDNPCDH